MSKIVRILVAPESSTVNGRPAIAHHDAREWFDGWKNLGLDDPRVYTDGKDHNGGQYLHVPLVGDEESRWYRVRCRYMTVPRRKRYKGHLVYSVRAEHHGGNWFWSLEVEEPSK